MADDPFPPSQGGLGGPGLSTPPPRLLEAIGRALVAGALPGETAGFTPGERAAAAALTFQALVTRVAGHASLACETAVNDQGRRQMRLAIVNDDMPFLVDSIAGAVSAHGLTVDRILHPVLKVTRTGSALESIGRGWPESLVYLEIDRPDAKARRALLIDIEASLVSVRTAVRDWQAMRAAMAADRDRLTGSDDAALLDWFLDRHFTQLGHARFERRGPDAALGIFQTLGDAILTAASRTRATAWLKEHPGRLLLIKSNCLSPVHRRAPLDLIIVADGTALSIHAGLWTSAALAAPAEDVPVLRLRLARLLAQMHFDPAGHAGKALAHALTRLPHDLSIALDDAALERLVLTAMSLEDRPRPKLLLAEDALNRQLFAFAWLPRDELSTARRVAIGAMIGEAANGAMLNWSIDLGDSGVARLRHTFDRRRSTRDPDERILDRALNAMVRGWRPSVEAALAKLGDAGRAARLAIRYAEAFPIAYRNGASAHETALDIDRLHGLAERSRRSVRLYRDGADGAARLRLKIYTLTPITLSDTVPPLENFGFRVIEEMSTPVGGGALGHVYRFIVELTGAAAEPVMARVGIIEAAIARVLEGSAENDGFNALVIAAGLVPREIILFRALFRYLRQTGLSYDLITVVDALRRRTVIARAIIALFEARHDSAGSNDEQSAQRAIDRGLAGVAAIDEDRILRQLRAVVLATLRTNFFARGTDEAIAFKFDSEAVPGLPAPIPWREIWVYSARVEGIHLRAGPIARGGLRWSDRREDFRTEILGLMKAQRVKNAVIVPTGAKGGFFPKQLPDPADGRDAWLAEGTESYRIFIRALLSVTDNVVSGRVVHPDQVVIRDEDDPYFVVAADKGTASFSDIANAIAIERGFWLGDAFASGGSVGYDHKAMGITARGA